MEILIRSTPDEASVLGARVVAKTLRQKPDAVLGLATGGTPLHLYEELIRLHREEGMDFSQVRTFNLDEYLGLSSEHPQSYRYYMDKYFFRHINIRPENTHLPDGMASDPRASCREYEAMIRDAGGIDLQILGLGSNGHIGFNEPTGSMVSRTWVKILSENTIRDNSQYFEKPEDVPRHCITMGIGTIMDARQCLLLAFGRRKANAVADMIEGPVSSMCPASALQFHHRVTVVVDSEAATLLHFKDHYLWVDSHKLEWQRYE